MMKILENNTEAIEEDGVEVIEGNEHQWLLLTIILYMSQIREQGIMGLIAGNNTNKKRDKKQQHQHPTNTQTKTKNL
jgi:hypothetical protein